MKKIIFLLIFGGLLASIIGMVWLNVKPAETIEKTTTQQDLKAVLPQVIVAKYPIYEGAILREQDFRWAEMDTTVGTQLTDVFLKGFITIESLEGSLLTRSLTANQALGSSDVIRPEQAHYMAAMLSPGMRAITLELTLAGVSYGLLRAGNRVDILLTSTNDHVGNTGFDVVTKHATNVVLEDTRLLAIDNVLTDVVSTRSDDHRDHGFTPDGRQTIPVTFEVTTKGAQRLMLAGKLGELSLMLRGRRQDTTQEDEGFPTLWDEQVSDNYHPNSKPINAIRIFDAEKVRTQPKALER